MTMFYAASLLRPEPPRTRLAYRVSTLGRIQHVSSHATPGTHYQDAMLTVILGGKGYYVRQGTTLTVTAGMVGLVLPPPLPNPSSQGSLQNSVGLLMADIDDPYDHLYCRFGGREAMRQARQIAKRLGSARFASLDVWRDVADVLLRALTLGPRHRPRERDEPMRQDASLLEALSLLLNPPMTDARQLTVARLRLYMEEHLCEPANLDVVADHFAVSKAHLCREAKRLLGRPLHESWTQLKMEWADVLLREPTLSVKQVAHRVGFADPLYFSKVFKRHVGVSPKQRRM